MADIAKFRMGSSQFNRLLLGAETATATETDPAETAPPPPPPPPDDPTNIIIDSKLAEVTKWTAAGFAALTAIAAFFGVKEGGLDVVVREHPYDVLYVFCLVGAGVVLSLVASAVYPHKIPFSRVILVTVVLIVFSSWVYSDFPDDDSFLGEVPFTLILVGVALVAIFLVGKVRISLVGAGVMVALAAVSAGLYGGTKLAIVSKSTNAETQVTAKLTRDELLSAVDVTVKSARLKQSDRVTVAVYGLLGDEETRVGTSELEPSATGEVDANPVFPVQPAKYEEFSVRVCASGKDCESSDSERVRLGSADASAISGNSSASLVLGDEGVVTVTYLSSGLVPGETHTLVVALVGEDEFQRVARATLSATPKGEISWTTDVKLPADAEGKLTLRDRLCADGTPKSCKPGPVVASVLVG